MDKSTLVDHDQAVGDGHRKTQHLLRDNDGDVSQLVDFIQDIRKKYPEHKDVWLLIMDG